MLGTKISIKLGRVMCGLDFGKVSIPQKMQSQRKVIQEMRMSKPGEDPWKFNQQ